MRGAPVIALALLIVGAAPYAKERKPVSLEKAQTLVKLYGAVLERCGEVVCSEELLPRAKEEIKAALVVVARAGRDSGELPPQALEQFRVAYASLATFMAPADAEVVRQFSNAIKAVGKISDASDERVAGLAEAVSGSRASEIVQRSNEEFAQLIKEFDAAAEP